MIHFINQHEKLHSNLLGLHVQSGSWVTDGTLYRLAAGLSAKSSGLTAASRAAEIIEGKLRLQAYSLTFIDGFYLVAWACAGMLLLTAILRKAPLSFAELSLFQQGFTPTQRKKP
jgi:DHA2 family multidrug resistance protein